MLFLGVALLFGSLTTRAAAGDLRSSVDASTEPKERCRGPSSPRGYLEQVVDSSVYDKTRRPACRNDSRSGPTAVEVQMLLAGINEVNQKLGTISINGFFKQWWEDPRLAFNSISEGGCFDVLNFDSNQDCHMWRPDLYFDNLVKRGSGGKMAGVLRVYPNGTVLLSEQVLLTVKVPFRLGKLPYDTQVGKITVASYSKPVSEIRVVARGGTLGPGLSGVGLEALGSIEHTVWSFLDNGQTAQDPGYPGFSTPGLVEDSGDWEYLTMQWIYSRKPKYYQDQVILPAGLFLFVSYVQFFVDPAAAPARAALAVIPVLIMRTLGNSVYAGIPPGAENIWLADYLTTSMLLCVLAAAEFGVVQHLLMTQKGREKKLDGLRRHRGAAKTLCEEARQKGVALLEFIEDFKAQEFDVGSESLADITLLNLSSSPAGKSEGGQKAVERSRTLRSSVTTASQMRRKLSLQAVRHSIKESDLIFIHQAKDIFIRFDTDHGDSLSVSEIRQALAHFNIYWTTPQTAAMVCMFQRDQGMTTPSNEANTALDFSTFTNLLLDLDNYTLPRRVQRWPCSLFSAKERLQSMPPSDRTDHLARVLYPLLMAVQMIVFYSALPFY